MSTAILGLDLPTLRQRRSLKWRLYGPEVLPLWVAEMDVLPAPPVVEAVRSALAIGDTGYPWAPDYAEALAGFAQRRWGWAADPGHMRVVTDVMLGITEVLKLLTGPGDAVVVNPPVYPPFYAFVSHLGRRVVEAPLSADGRLDLTTLEESFRAARPGGNRAAYLLCSPHNPTGAVHSPEELTAAGELAERHGVRVVVDEIHAPLVYPDRRFTPYLSLPVGENAITVMSASKGFNLAGLNAAMAIAGPRAWADLDQMPEEAGHGASHVGALAQGAALRHGDDWLDRLLAELDGNRRLVGRLVGDLLPGVGYRPPEGSYLAWLDFRSLGLGDDPAAVFRERAMVALMPGNGFGAGGAGHARLNFATSPEIVTEAVQRLAGSI